jgi:hypothetical protein
MRYLILFFTFVLLLTGCKKDKDPVPSADIEPNDFLSAANYNKLIIQVNYINGFKPDETSINNLKNFLDQRINKPNGIEIVYTVMNATGKQVYTMEDIRALEKYSRTKNPNGNDLAAYLFFIDGDYNGNSGNLKTLGLAYGPTSMVIFEKTIKDLSGGIGQPSVMSVETTVAEHEFGHILGLVNNGTGMVNAHQDEPNGKHCNNSNCLMYWATENNNLISNLIGNNIPTLDGNCALDLKANGGK